METISSKCVFTKDDPRNENYIKYSRYRFYLRSTYNTVQNIKNAESAEAISTTLDASKPLEKGSRASAERLLFGKTLTVVPKVAAITAWSGH